MNIEQASSENLKFSQKAELVKKIKEISLSPDNERLALLVAIKELSFAELDFPEGASSAILAMKALDNCGLYITIENSTTGNKVIVSNNREDFEEFNKHNLEP
ncbi:MAG: hypothetical protein NT165_03175 [Candidatus Falkowbacteria bacterium]|nr:hypothetical protein [Candidatus Falkowbacteria bacterium]